MTREESMTKLVELRTKVDGFVKTYNEAYQSGKMEKAMKARTEAENNVNEYTRIVRDMCFEECKESGDPMRKAVEMLSFVTIALKDNKPKEEEKFAVLTVVDKEKPIDLEKLHKYCGTIGKDPQWLYKAQKLNFLMTCKVCEELGIDPKEVHDSYSMAEIAKQVDMGKNPTSNTNLLKSMQTVVTAMLGEDCKATSHDVRFMDRSYARKGKKALSVACANHKTFFGIMAEVCHRIITPGAQYTVDYKKIKEAGNGGQVVVTTPGAIDKPKAPRKGKKQDEAKTEVKAEPAA